MPSPLNALRSRIAAQIDPTVSLSQTARPAAPLQAADFRPQPSAPTMPMPATSGAPTAMSPRQFLGFRPRA